MSVRRPKTQTKRCTHCHRRRLRHLIEWHPGICEWQCSNFADCDAAIDKRGGYWALHRSQASAR